MAGLRNNIVELISIGCSWGGVRALLRIVKGLDAGFSIPIVVVIHQRRDVPSELCDLLRHSTQNKVIEAEEKMEIEASSIIVAPPNYHLLVERDRSLSLSLDAPIMYSRPAIDVFLESASDTYGKSLLAVILTGANADGAAGAKAVKEQAGRVFIQSPDDAEMPVMPQAALDAVEPDYCGSIEGIIEQLNDLEGVAL